MVHGTISSCSSFLPQLSAAALAAGALSIVKMLRKCHWDHFYCSVWLIYEKLSKTGDALEIKHVLGNTIPSLFVLDLTGLSSQLLGRRNLVVRVKEERVFKKKLCKAVYMLGFFFFLLTIHLKVDSIHFSLT